jgi:6-phosphogluconolactonase
MAPARHDFDGPDALAEALASAVEERLASRLAQGGRASLALSGGRTPARFLRALARRTLDWSRVDVTLVDERWVGEDSPRSNAALLRDGLIRDEAATATFYPLYRAGGTPDGERGAVEAMVRGLPHPFACVVLGMGDDGHTASFFPGGDTLAAAIDPATPRLVEALRAPAAGEPRITLTLPALLASDLVCVHIEGETKKAVLAQALADGPVEDMPVRAVLRQDRTPVRVYWCP